jgi:hypothetical protein
MANYKAEGPFKTVSTPEEFALPGQMKNVDRRTPGAVIEDVTAKITAKGGDPYSRAQSLPASVHDSYEAGTLKQTHPQYTTIRHESLPRRGAGESHKNYTKKLASTLHGALWMRALSLPGTIMGSVPNEENPDVRRGVLHFDKDEFEKHWTYHPADFSEASKRGPIAPPTNDEYNAVHQSVMSSGINQSNAEWQDMYSDSGNSYTDEDGTATGDAQ